MSGVPLGPFELSEVIGIGGGGEVWSGRHLAQGVPVAVKVMTAARAKDPTYHEAFRNEVRAVAGLDHPGVVRVFDFGTVDAEAEVSSEGRLVAGSPFLAMELAGQSLRELPLPQSFDALRLRLLWLLDILAHAHAHGVIHRDLKPGNVLVFEDPAVAGDVDGASRLRLTDFGLAYATEAGGGALKGTAGTPTFMAPEQFRGRWREFGPPTDLYAVGCMGFMMATGSAPFQGMEISDLMHAHLSMPPPPLLPTFPVPDGFEGWLARLLHKRPVRRFQRAADAAHALMSLGEPGEGAGFSRVVAPVGPLTWAPSSSEAVTRESSMSTASQTSELPTLSGTSMSLHDLVVPAAPERVQDEEEGLLCPRVLPPIPSSWRAELPQRPNMKLVGAGLGLYGLRAIPLVARESERDAMWAALSAVRQVGGTRVIVLHGRAGTGKSRLAQWLSMLADSLGSALVLRATHSPGGGPADGLGPMMGTLTRCLGLEREAMAARLTRWLRERSLRDSGAVMGLLELIAPRGEDAGVLSANERHALIQSVAGAAARAQTEGPKRPALFWLDDAQWGQDAIGFAQWLMGPGARSDVPALVVLTVEDGALVDRPVAAERLAMLERLPAVTRLEVGALTEADRNVLVQELLYLEGDLADQVQKRTQGNPLFAVQLVGDWVQRGVLDVGETGFVLREGERAVIPDDIHQLWMSRVDRVLQEGREALEIAAMLGTVVDDGEWRGATRVADVGVRESLLADLVQHQLVRQGAGQWAFVHGMLRESLERSARESGRVERLHRAIATTLQIRRDVSAQRGLAERLARHLILGGREEEAIEPLLDAALERRSMSDYLGALGGLDQRESVLDDLGVSQTDPRRGQGWVLRADALICMGRLEEAEATANRVVRVGRRRYWESMMAPALRHAAIAVGKRGQYAAAARRLKRAVEAARYGGSPVEAARCQLFLGDVARLQGAHEDAAGHCGQALARFRALDDGRGMGDALNGLAGVYLSMGELEQAQRFCEAAIEQFENVGARFGIASTQNALGDVLRQQGNLEGAKEAYALAEVGLHALGSAEHTVPALNLALVDVEQGAFEGARTRLLTLLDGLRKSRRLGLVAICHAALLPPLAAAREWRAFSLHLRATRARLEETGLVDADVARCAALAADLAREGGNGEAVRATVRLACAQWTALGQSDRAHALQKQHGVG